jgi:hypothetical protein
LPALLTRPAKPIPAGWDDLAFCLDLVSFDGARALSLSNDGTATIEDKSRSPSAKEIGMWELSGPDRYTIKIGEEETSYERIASREADICILAAGNADVASLRRSWFAIRPNDPPLDN